MSTIHYINGEFKKSDNATLSALDLAVIRGYGVFDYVQLYKGQPFHLMDHLKRLKWSAEQVELPLPLSLDEIYDLTYLLIEKNHPIDAGIRLIITGGHSSHDQLLPSKGSTLMMLFHPFTPYHERYYTKGMKAITTPMLRIMPSVKTTNYMPAIFAMRKAKLAGCDDALYVNNQQHLLEGTTCNLFFFKNGTLITCDSDEIVKGVTRNILLRIASRYFPIEYRSLYLDEITSCEEAFLCSSVKDVIPLVQIDDKRVGNGLPGHQTELLRSLYRSYIADYLSKESNCERLKLAVV